MLKKVLKKIPGIKLILNYVNIKIKNRDFNKDKKFFKKNYMYSKPKTKEKLQYDMMFEIHKLEKGFAAKNPRPFGIEKIKRIIKNIEEYEKLNFKTGFEYNLSYSALEEYLNFYEKNKWCDNEEYKIVKEFMSGKHQYKHIKVGALDYRKQDFIDDTKINYDKFISSRRSIRNFSSKKLDENDIKKAINMAIKTPTACNRQMCKIYYIETNQNKKIIEKYGQGLGLFDLINANYFVITFDMSANYFSGERNQGWFNSGLVTMNFINALHSLGIGSCCIQFGNSFNEEVEFKKKLNIPSNERVSVIITCGYYDDIMRIPYSARKPIEDIYKKR